MRLFGRISGFITVGDRAEWQTPPFDLQLYTPGGVPPTPVALVLQSATDGFAVNAEAVEQFPACIATGELFGIGDGQTDVTQ